MTEQFESVECAFDGMMVSKFNILHMKGCGIILSLILSFSTLEFRHRFSGFVTGINFIYTNWLFFLSLN